MVGDISHSNLIYVPNGDELNPTTSNNVTTSSPYRFEHWWPANTTNTTVWAYETAVQNAALYTSFRASEDFIDGWGPFNLAI